MVAVFVVAIGTAQLLVVIWSEPFVTAFVIDKFIVEVLLLQP